MVGTAPFDARGVANLLLDLADQQSTPVTNLVLQKLLYFAHARFLIATEKPLLTGYFEAWRYGPVHPAVYQAFRDAREAAIDFRASRTNLLTDQRSVVPCPDSALVRDHLRFVVTTYGQMPVSRLVEISHAPGAPWHFIVSRAKKAVTLGLRIPDTVIVDRFKRHKIAVRPVLDLGESVEDAPLTGD